MADHGPGPEAEPGGRGRLTISDRAVEKVAGIAASQVENVVRSGSGLDSLLGRRYPQADATVAGRRVRVEVQIAVSWPQPLAAVGSAVRDRVHEQLTGLLGLQVDAVDVTTATVVTDGPASRRVR